MNQEKLTIVQRFSKCDELTKLGRMYQGVCIKMLEEDVDIFVSKITRGHTT